MMKPAREQPTKIPAWVKLNDLPLELWNQECLSRIASSIGRPLHVDHATAKTARQPGLQQTKSTKARIYIEVSAEQVLPDEVQVVVEGESIVIPVEYQVLPPMCNICHVFGHHTSKCARGASISSPPQQPADQVWTRVGNGKQKVGCEQSKTEQLNCPVDVLASIVPQQLNNPMVSPIPEEEVNDSEEELLEVLEGVVSSSQRAEPIVPQEKETSGVNQSTSAPFTLSKSAAKKAAQRAAKLKNKVPPDVIADDKLTKGGSNKASQSGRQQSFSKSSNTSGK